jgi:Transcriptional regulatory protein, C terminal
VHHAGPDANATQARIRIVIQIIVGFQTSTAHPGRLVTKAEVQAHVWGDTHVTDTVLRVSVREIRAALGDAAGAPGISK